MNYSRIYNNIILNSQQRGKPSGYYEKHHIIPRCMGGTDNPSNIATLLPEEHFLCHILLVKMYPNNRKLIYAVQMMCCSCSKRPSRKLYGWLKRQYVDRRRMDAAGSKNNTYGKCWINKLGTNENKLISKYDILPDGWQFGRVLKTERTITKVQKIKKCKACGSELCSTKELCAKYNLANSSLSKYFDFDLSTIGTLQFPKEVVRVKTLISTLYHDNHLSVGDLAEKYDVPTNEAMRCIMRSLNIERRNLKDAYYASANVNL